MIKEYIAKYGVKFFVSDDGKIYSKNNKLLSHYEDKVGYKSVVGRDWENKPHRYLIHRLVAGAFIGDIEEKQVHHKDEDKSNNRVDNLEILTITEHDKIHKWKYPETKICVICGKKFKPYESKRKDGKVCSEECKQKLYIINASKRKKSIEQLDINDNLIKIWNSAKDIQNELGYSGSNIAKCCKGIIKSYKGFHWKYHTEG